ncbi:MAG TPA: hypothetical protein VFN97_14020 [Actinospica sp.]|nr:hypothetical protein [Actinospica sp.]
MHGAVSVFLYMGAVLVALGVFGFLTERRKRGRDGVRRFLIWYALAWPFMACALAAELYPRLHWLYSVSIAIAVASYVVQIRGWRRARAQAKADRPPADS